MALKLRCKHCKAVDLTVIILNCHCGCHWRPLIDTICLEIACNTEVKEEVLISLINFIIDDCHHTGGSTRASRDGNG